MKKEYKAIAEREVSRDEVQEWLFGIPNGYVFFEVKKILNDRIFSFHKEIAPGHVGKISFFPQCAWYLSNSNMFAVSPGFKDEFPRLPESDRLFLKEQKKVDLDSWVESLRGSPGRSLGKVFLDGEGVLRISVGDLTRLVIFPEINSDEIEWSIHLTGLVEKNIKNDIFLSENRFLLVQLLRVEGEEAE